MAKYFLVFPTICFISLVLLVGASGTGSTHVEEGNHFATDLLQGRTRRDVATLPPNEFVDEDNNQKSNQINVGSSLKELSISKRTPSGFMGMRGKKEYDSFSEQPRNDNSLDWEDPGSEQEHEDTAAELNGNRYKKATATFYGVRGKKYWSGGDIVGNEVAELNALLSKLEEDRMREQLLQNLLNRVAASTGYQNEINKRAPIGFTGLRGKRPLVNFYYDEQEQEPTDTDVGGGVGEQSEFGKRGSANAFVGLRGKKEASQLIADKRSVMEPYATRGKQQRFVDFSNKFVAVRGKKNLVDDLSSYFSGAANAQLYAYPGTHERYLVGRLPSAAMYGANGKRTPSGFMGMRGKRAAVAASAAATDADATEPSAASAALPQPHGA